MTCRLKHFLLILSIFLSACNNAEKDLLSTEPPKGEITGKVVDAVLVGATIRVYEWHEGEIVSNIISETMTDINGHYLLEPNYYDAYLILKATGGAYIEEATGTQVDLQPGQELTALVQYESGSAIELNITVLTHWATCMAQWRAKTQSNNNADAVNLSYDLFSTMAGVAVREVEPLNITDPNNAAPVINEGLMYGIYPAAISSLTQELSERSGQAPHTLTSTTSIHFAQIGCNDIRADGKLDGQGFTTDDTQISPLGFGTVPLTPRVYRTEVAQHMLTIARSALNKTGLDATDYFNRAQSLSTMDSDVFDKIAPESVDLDGPIISIDVPANTFLKGSVDLAFSITDPLGIKQIEFYVDNNLESVNKGDNTLFSLDTTCCNYADGAHEIKVLAYDAFDNVSTFIRMFNFDNSGPIVTVNSPALVNNVNYLATGTYQLEGADIKTVWVNGAAATLNISESTWTSTISLDPGNNTIIVQAEDNNNNFSAELMVDVAVDTVIPELRNADNTPVFTSTGQSQYASCIEGTMEFDNLAAVCIPDNRISLNGQQVSINLLNDSYTLIAYQVNDAPTDGVFTSADNLIIDYKVEKNGSLLQDWKTAPARNPEDTDWFLPLTTEYLGDTWFQSAIDNVFVITFRVTDLAGNTATNTYSMRFNVSPNTIPVIAPSSNEEIITTTNFNNRLKVDGKTFLIKYTYASDPSVGYYMLLEGVDQPLTDFLRIPGKATTFFGNFTSAQYTSLNFFQPISNKLLCNKARNVNIA